MKVNFTELPNGKNTPLNSPTKVVLLILTLVLLTTIPLYLYNNSLSLLWPSVPPYQSNKSSQPPGMNISDTNSTSLEHKCDIFSGKWIPNPNGPYYTNASNCVIDDRQNCMKFGRPDTAFMKWRWKPDECELPLFDAAQFLELVRGKSMAFVGDSVGRNQMQSLVCLLASVARPVDVTNVQEARFSHWLYTDYNFTLVNLWSTHLVKSQDADPNGFSLNSLMNLYLDQVDDAWAAQIETFDYVIISAGQWFSRPFMYYEKGKLVGCHICNKKNVTDLTRYYGYRKAFGTAFRTLLELQNFKGVTFLRTFSPAHFENGEWNKGGNCVRKRPFTEGEMKFEGYMLDFYVTQMEEFRAAEREGRKKGLKFRLLDTSEAMVLRPDGHPNHYGHWPNENVSIADCVHWCLPGPIDTWNEFLLQMLRMEGDGLIEGKPDQPNV
ncbi:hypothetical protein F0562_005240 [Nyssa sinensis]|uniref:Uncharacterized protein n=1 Tax=Nyssa sinensis TaxID=561372 RepID=A0A5J5AN78_9ASTE|nr:hypothetical protein F0562_005240 [Nyssa sinensis]